MRAVLAERVEQEQIILMVVHMAVELKADILVVVGVELIQIQASLAMEVLVVGVHIRHQQQVILERLILLL
jgi:hypothetical protein